ncbi:hypothetical protein IDG49_03240 [Pelagibacterales bacterium SAG-MED07]|nr:hypothetical protein [Pelagibacterales bacterium SAG-MED07]
MLNPDKNIKPKEVVKIQLTGLQQNDLNYQDSGIEQTWNFAHPNNKKVTGPLNNFKRMLKGNSYQMMKAKFSLYRGYENHFSNGFTRRR